MNEIKFNAALVKRLNNAMADASVAVGEAAMSAVAQDSRVTVRTFASALRDAAPMLGTSNCVLAAAVKAAKEKGAELDKVCEAMAEAADKKRKDDRRRAADRAAEAPGKALAKALAEVEECKLALRSPMEVARDIGAPTEAADNAPAAALRDARAARRAAQVALEAVQAEAEQTEQAA